MKEILFQLITFSTLFVLIASKQVPAQHFFLENELVLDLAAGSSDEWIVKTEPNHIFYFSFLTNAHDDEQQISSSLTIVDVNNPDSLLFPSEDNKLSPFYSTSNAVSIKFPSASLNLNSFRLKIEMAVPCPSDIGGGSSCGRVVDELSCYCGLFAARSWADTKSYCESYNMTFLSVESYEEDLSVFNTFGGFEVLWIGLSDIKKETNFVWDSTGLDLYPGYMSWVPGHPSYKSCGGDNSDCVAYEISSALPAWIDLPCESNYSGICELQPTNSFNRRSTQQVNLSLDKELIFDLSGSFDALIISTDSNHIFYFSFITSENPDSIDEQQKEELQSSLSILDVNHSDIQLFPSNIDALSPFYSIGDTVSIKIINKPSSSLMNAGIQLKVEKAVPCPLNLGGSSSCGRVVDELSCYCATYVIRTWSETRDFCKANNMNFVAIESYEEDIALNTAFVKDARLWIGASDSFMEGYREGSFVWESTGKNMSPGYQGWAPGYPLTNCVTEKYDCMSNGYCNISILHGCVDMGFAWIDTSCSSNFGGICELQPTDF